jgi:hypothetical protein
MQFSTQALPVLPLNHIQNCIAFKIDVTITEVPDISYVTNRSVIGGHRRRENLGDLVVDGRKFVLNEEVTECIQPGFCKDFFTWRNGPGWLRPPNC